MAPHCSTFAWKIPWTEEPGRLQSMGSLRVRHDWSDLAAAAAALIENHLQYIDTEDVFFFFFKKGKKLAPNATLSKQQKSQELYLSLTGYEAWALNHSVAHTTSKMTTLWSTRAGDHTGECTSPVMGCFKRGSPPIAAICSHSRALFRTTNCPLKLSFPGWNTKPSWWCSQSSAFCGWLRGLPSIP